MAGSISAHLQVGDEVFWEQETFASETWGAKADIGTVLGINNDEAFISVERCGVVFELWVESQYLQPVLFMGAGE